MKRLLYSILIIIACTYIFASTELADYVAKTDDNYTWTIVSTQSNSDGGVFILDMTSQQWLTKAEVDYPLWQHRMAVYVPADAQHTTALLVIGAGTRTSQLKYQGNHLLMDIARRTKTITATVLNVPNQPLVFSDDPQQRKRNEDDILAYQWAKYLKKPAPEHLTLLPMVKSTVRAMDTVVALCAANPTTKPIKIESFVVTGKSKRGWTTWLTAAVDKRVIAIAPQVIDMLNMQVSMQHHHRAYGEYSRAVYSYVENGIMLAIDTPQAAASLQIIDPYSYRAVLTMPKMIINSGGDQFFLPDSSQFYYDKLIAPKHLRYIPNCGHGLDGSEIRTLLSFYASVLNNTPLPSYKWSVSKDGQICVTAESKPLEVKLWQIDNAENRDFRVDVIGKTWRQSIVTPQEGEHEKFVYTTDMEQPEKGWRAFFVELIFPDKVSERLSLTTEISVLPQTLPFEK